MENDDKDDGKHIYLYFSSLNDCNITFLSHPCF